MSYIKQNVQGSYELTVNDRNKAYLSALKNFLVDNGFTFVSEDYTVTGKESIVLRLVNTQYKIVSASSGLTSSSISIIVSKLLDDSTTKVVNNSNINIILTTLTTNVADDNSIKPAYATSSTVLLIKNKSSFTLVITSFENGITSSNNIVTGNIAYKLIDGTDSDMSYVSSSNTFTAIEKSQGNAVTLNVAHNRLDDERLIYENKVSVNQSNMFVGDSDEVVGLVGAEKCKIYQTSQGKYFAFANDTAMLMGDELL